MVVRQEDAVLLGLRVKIPYLGTGVSDRGGGSDASTIATANHQNLLGIVTASANGQPGTRRVPHLTATSTPPKKRTPGAWSQRC